jgi:hypothetical protein
MIAFLINQLVNVYGIASRETVAPTPKNLTTWGDKSSIVCGGD